MENYSFLTVAPCSFRVEGQVFTLSAGQTFSVSPSIGQKLIAPSFTYRNFITLIYKPTEPTTAETKSIPKTEKPKESKKVVSKTELTQPIEPLVVEAALPTESVNKVEPVKTEVVKETTAVIPPTTDTIVESETKKSRSTKKQS